MSAAKREVIAGKLTGGTRAADGEVSVVNRAFETAFNATAVGGVTVTVGLPAPGAMSQIEPLKITAEARQIIGSYLGSAVPAVDIPKYEQMWRDGVLPLEKLITSHITLDQINEAMDELDAGRAVRQVIEF